MSKKRVFSQTNRHFFSSWHRAHKSVFSKYYLCVSPQRSEEEMSRSVFKEQAKDITVPVEVTVRNGRCSHHRCRYHHLSHHLCFITIVFVQDRKSISSLSQSSLSQVLILSKSSRASGHTLDKNSFSFETGVPTALSTEDFYEDQQKVTNTLAMII